MLLRAGSTEDSESEIAARWQLESHGLVGRPEVPAGRDRAEAAELSQRRRGRGGFRVRDPESRAREDPSRADPSSEAARAGLARRVGLSRFRLGFAPGCL